MFLKGRVAKRERERREVEERKIASAGSFPKSLQQLGLVFCMSGRSPRNWAINCCFLRHITWKLDLKQSTRDLHSDVGCWCHRSKFSLLGHNTSPNVETCASSISQH